MKRLIIAFLWCVLFVACSLVAPAAPTPDLSILTPMPTSTFAPTRGSIAALELSGRLLYTQGAAGLWELDLQSGEQRQLWPAPQGTLLNGVAASPDGSRLVMAVAPAAGAAQFGLTNLYLADADGSNMELFLERTDALESFSSPTWSPDGAWIYYGHVLPMREEDGDYVGSRLMIERVAVTGGEPEVVIKGGEQPSLSGDGERLTYIAFDQETQLRGGIWIANADGGEARELVPANAFFAMLAPRLSPDGSRVAFAASGDLQTATSPGRGLPGWFVADVAFAHGPPWEMWTILAEGGQMERLTDMATDSPWPAWSPDGTDMAMLQPGGVFLLGEGDPRFLALAEGHGELVWEAAQ